LLKRNAPLALLALMLLCVTLVHIPFATAQVQPTYTGNTIIDFNDFGIASVDQRILATDVEILGAIGKLLYVQSVDPSSVSYYVENNTIVLVPPTNFTGVVEVKYITQLALPSGNDWNSNFTVPTNFTVILPYGAVPTLIDPIPINFTITSDGRIALTFLPGTLNLSYAMASSTATTSKPPTTSTTTQPVGTTTSTTTTQQPAPAEASQLIYISLFIILAIILIIVFLFRNRFFRRKG